MIVSKPMRVVTGVTMSDGSVVPLNLISSNGSGVVVAFEGGRQFRERIVSMGLNIGSRIQVVLARGSGPILVGVGETRLAIGQGMARKIRVAMDKVAE